MNAKLIITTGVVAMTGFVYTSSAQFTDNFDDGNDAGWTQYNPIVGSAYSFPVSSQGGLGYQMTAPSGNGRVGSFLTSMPATPDGVFSVDLINWTLGVRQEMGVAARVQAPVVISPSLFFQGYSLTYVNRFSAGAGGTDQLRIYRWSLTSLGFINQDITLTANGSAGQFSANANPPFSGGSAAPAPLGDYRLVFKVYGSSLSGQMIDIATGLPLLFSDGLGGATDTVHAIDTTYTTGIGGLITFQLGTNPTYDNFSVVPEPSTWAVATLGFLGLVVRNVRRFKRTF